MENKLQQLTEKLYAEGLEKGRSQANELLTAAKDEAARIITAAKSDADKIIGDARHKADELTKNTANDIRMASAQTLSTLRAQIETMIVDNVIEPKVSAAWSDSSFIKGLIIDAVKSWSPSSEAPITITVPQNMMDDVRGSIAQQFATATQVHFDGKMRIPFRIAPKDGSYYVSFTDEDFANLIKESLRPRVAQMLFGEK